MHDTPIVYRYGISFDLELLEQIFKRRQLHSDLVVGSRLVIADSRPDSLSSDTYIGLEDY